MTCWDQFQKIVTDKKPSVILSTIFYMIISLCLLLYYTDEKNIIISKKEVNQTYRREQIYLYDSRYQTYTEISIAASTIMLLGLFGIILLTFRYHKISVYFIIGFLNLALLLFLIGVFIGQTSLSSIDMTFPAPIVFWLVQLMLTQLAHQTILIIQPQQNSAATQITPNHTQATPASNEQPQNQIKNQNASKIQLSYHTGLTVQ